MSKNESNLQPPQWPVQLLRFFVKKQYLEEIEGDLEELFQEDVAQFSVKKARRRYVWELIRLLRPGLVRNLDFINRLTNFGMLRNYTKVSLRSLMKNPFTSTVNLAGLALAIGVSVFAFGFARWVFSTDQFHEHKDNVFLATFFANREGVEQQFGPSPRPLGEFLQHDFPQVTAMSRVADLSAVVKSGDRVFHERIRCVDADFLKMLTFPLKWGVSQTLADVNSIILSEESSKKYFGEENPIGQMLYVKFSKEVAKEFKVTGVANRLPDASTIRFDFLVNFHNLKVADPSYNRDDWREAVAATIIQVAHPDDIKVIESKMEKYRLLQNKAAEVDWAITSFAFEPLATLHERSEFIRSGISRSSKGNYTSVIFLLVISVFLLALACLNYINIAIVSAAKRLKEIGVRKTIGASRSRVIVQFLAENVITTFLALVMGLLIGFFLFVPGFEAMWDFDMEFRMSDPKLWIFLPGILLLTGFLSGVYPAFYISRFQAVQVLKGAVTFKRKNYLTKAFLGIQLVLACIFLAAAVMFTQNNAYMAKRSWGYQQHGALFAKVSDAQSFDQLAAAVVQLPDVVSWSGSVHHLGRSNGVAVVHLPEQDYETDLMAVDENYFSTMGLELLQGRVFQSREVADGQSIVVNEAFANAMNIVEPLHEVVKMDTTEYTIVGIVKDFHSYSFSRKVKPAVFVNASKDQLHYLCIRILPGAEQKAHQALQLRWSQLFPETPFDGGFQEDVWGGYYQQLEIHSTVWKVIASIAVLLAMLGLYGLVTLTVEARRKEFSIRKVMGARAGNVARSITRDYIVLFVAALVTGAPISYLLLRFILDSAYAYHMPIDFTGTAIAAALLTAMIASVVAVQVYKVHHSNPVAGLKSE